MTDDGVVLGLPEFVGARLHPLYCHFPSLFKLSVCWILEASGVRGASWDAAGTTRGHDDGFLVVLHVQVVGECEKVITRED